MALPNLSGLGESTGRGSELLHAELKIRDPRE